MNDHGKTHFERTVTLAIHFCVWAYVLGSPLLFQRGGEEIDWVNYLRRLYFPMTSCVVFYLNYFWLVPRLLLKKHTAQFFLYNALTIALILVLRDYYVQLFPPVEFTHRPRRMRAAMQQAGGFPWFRVMFYLRSAISLCFLAFLATAVRLSLKWREAERQRQQAEVARGEAVLQNLRNQINPHFLLNTLNNIYALTAFDPAKAGEAVQELSRLLRYVLYENTARYVPLRREAEFLRSYIALMRMRLNQRVKVSVNIDVPADDSVQVAPLLFISAVENAFKHGISPTQPSFVTINLTVTGEAIQFRCENSNFPKAAGDKSPGGIGLKQVQARLDLMYPGRYRYSTGASPDGATYHSTITLNHAHE